MTGRSISAGQWTEASGCRVTAAPVPLDYWPHRDASLFVEADGSRWHLQRMGSGPVLLLIHGTAASTHSWRDLMPLLARQFDVVALDLPGHGFTERLPCGSMSLPAISRGIAGLLQDLGVTPDLVVGHSAGAAIALQMTLDGELSPRCVVGLNAALLPFGGAMQSLFAPLARFFANTRLMPGLVARRAGDIRAVRRMLRGTGSEIDAAGTRMYQFLLQQPEHVATVLSMMASWELQPMLDELHRLEPQLHLVVGSDDKAVSPLEAERVAAALPGTTVVRLPGCGHLAHEEQPDRVADLIGDFCSLDSGETHAGD